MKQIRQLAFISKHAHTPATASRGCLHNHGVANITRPFLCLIHRIDDAIGAGKDRDPRLLHCLPRFFLLTHHASDLRRRSDEFNAAGLADFGKIRVFAQQAVARVDGIHIGDLGGADDRRNVEVALGGAWRAHADGFIGKAYVQRIPISLAVNRDSSYAQLFAGTDDPQGDFTAICYKDFLKHVRIQYGPATTTWGVWRIKAAKSWAYELS